MAIQNTDTDTKMNSPGGTGRQTPAETNQHDVQNITLGRINLKSRYVTSTLSAILIVLLISIVGILLYLFIGPPVVDLCEAKNNCTFYEKCRVLNDRASCEEEDQFVDAVVITSGGYGVSAEYQGNLFGLYLKQYGTKNDAPYYRQASFHKKEMFLYRSSDKTWNIGSDIFSYSSERKYVYNSLMSTTVPERGWGFHIGTGIWAMDRYIEVKNVKELNADEICAKVIITGDEEHKFNEYFGQYDNLVLDGVKIFSNGRNVYHNNKKKAFLQVRKGDVVWNVCDDLGCSSVAFYSAGGANNLNPASSEAAQSDRYPGRKGWGFRENGEWVNLIGLNVTCVN